MAGVEEGFEMKDMSKKFPEYNDMDQDQLENEYGLFAIRSLDDPTNKSELEDIKKRKKYLDTLLKDENTETTFIDNDDGKTVSITNGDNTLNVPSVSFDNIDHPQQKTTFILTQYIKKLEADNNFNLDYSVESLELRSRLGFNKKGDLTFKPTLKNGELGNPRVVLVRNGDDFNLNNSNEEVVSEFMIIKVVDAHGRH